MTGFPGKQHEVYGVIGQELTYDNPRLGVEDDGLVAWPERVELCRRHWPEGRREDFTPGRHGRWVDSTGAAFEQIRGCGPVMSPTLEACDVWFVADGKLVLLIREERAERPRTVFHGEIISRKL